jgi:hypothetical protein
MCTSSCVWLYVYMCVCVCVCHGLDKMLWRHHKRAKNYCCKVHGAQQIQGTFQNIDDYFISQLPAASAYNHVISLWFLKECNEANSTVGLDIGYHSICLTFNMRISLLTAYNCQWLIYEELHWCLDEILTINQQFKVKFVNTIINCFFVVSLHLMYIHYRSYSLHDQRSCRERWICI